MCAGHCCYITSPYTHNLYTLPNDANTCMSPDQHTENLTPTSLGTLEIMIIYLVGNLLALAPLPSHTAMTALHITLESI
jgi:hypothetical protein